MDDRIDPGKPEPEPENLHEQTESALVKNSSLWYTHNIFFIQHKNR